MDGPDVTDLVSRTLGVADAVSVQRLVNQCPPLTVHTPYAYWVALSSPAPLSVGLFEEDELLAFVLAIPRTRDRFLIWQVAVAPSRRGQGLAPELLGAVWDLAVAERFFSGETTIARDNLPSRRSFERMAEEKGLRLEQSGEAIVRDAAADVVEREDIFVISPRTSD